MCNPASPCRAVPEYAIHSPNLGSFFFEIFMQKTVYRLLRVVF